MAARRVTAHCADLSHARGGGPSALRIRRVTALRDCGASPGPEWASSAFTPRGAARPDAGPRADAGLSATMLSVNVHLQVLSHNGRGLFPDARPAFEKCRSALAGNGGTKVELVLESDGRWRLVCARPACRNCYQYMSPSTTKYGERGR